ncbi:hypothetical protein RCL_jg9834.t1 [Rhizophagus clarus]|uniref:Uncharacterized protein n=1 Tax=Rhizophagus clarus TaxID=94130 RepID=A0A8H3LV82_9GLOM|nr:hypothetical protein RCL_jg9834.t1 [Rhizophagus clarus]
MCNKIFYPSFCDTNEERTEKSFFRNEENIEEEYYISEEEEEPEYDNYVNTHSLRIWKRKTKRVRTGNEMGEGDIFYLYEL